MCGLAGILSPTPVSTSQQAALVSVMTRRLAHRGPDAQCVWVSGPLALGHRRLAVVELSEAGAQPMKSRSNRYTIVFNGEIYNHLELRRDIEEQGHVFVWCGQSDTETLLACIEVWGIDAAVDKLNGMFAFALWDMQTQSLVLGRDRIGEKPLYWGWAGENIIFGSELKALRAHPDCPSELSDEALDLFFRLSYVPAPYAIFSGIYKLQPGCLLYIRGSPPAIPPPEPMDPGQKYGSIELVSYWSLKERFDKIGATFAGSPTEAVEHVGYLLEKAVKRQMLSDVPLGAFLSGGIDSSLVVSLMQSQSQVPVQTFTVGFQEKAYDESGYARAVAHHLGTEHHELVLSDLDVIGVVPKLAEIYDEPFADSSQIPTFLVSRLARRQVIVSLSGDAGDELFCGYGRYFWAPKIWRRVGPLPSALRRQFGAVLGSSPDELLGMLSRLMRMKQSGAQIHRVAGHMRYAKSVQDVFERMLSAWPDDTPLSIKQHLQPLPWHRGNAPKIFSSDDVGLMMSKDLCAYLPDDILCKVDRASMSVSLETRVPFLDVPVLEAAMAIPTSIKVFDSRGKWILRELLERFVPRSLTDRPKVGFGVPLGTWLRGPLKPWAANLLSRSALLKSGKLDLEIIEATWTEHLEGRADNSERLWPVLMFQDWLYAQ